MGLWSWLFPTPEDRIAKARRLLDQKQPADARHQVIDLDRPDARALLVEAETALARLNLDAALGYGNAGDEARVRIHLDLAEQFHHGGLEEAFREVRRELRAQRAARTEAQQRAKEEEDRRLMAVDPLGIQGGPSWLDPVPDRDVLAPDDEERAQRLALLIENYPEDLRGALRALGAPFARAVLDLDDGRPDLAHTALLGLPDEQPLVQWERARTAHVLGDPAAAARAVRTFAEALGGHRSMGQLHSAAYLAQLLAESGDVSGGLRVLRAARATTPEVGGVLYAQLLEANDELAEADTVLTDQIRRHPTAQALYALLARVRLRGGQRVPAMRALEASMEAICCTPGKCGSQPPSLDIVRTLATLYLEDGIERARALELAEQAAGLATEPSWEDAYLAALAGRVTGSPDTEGIIAMLREHTSPDDPRARRLAQHLA